VEKSSFFNSVNGDRKYKASDFADFFNSLLTNGVFPNPATNLQVIANNDMTVTIKTGKAWINGYCYYNDSDLILPITVADGVLNRIDRIVLRLDTVGRAINTIVKKGTFASAPVALALQRDADAYELGIADIYIRAGVIAVIQSNVTDLRMNTSYCGWVNSLIQADTTAIFNQYQAWFTATSGQYNADMSANEASFTNQFNTWFASIQNTLGADVAGNLLNKINNLAGDGRTTETVKANADAIAILKGSGSIVEKANKSDLAALSSSVSSQLADTAYKTATGTATAILVTMQPLVDGYSKTFVVSANNAGAATTINGKHLYKPNTTTSPTLIGGKAVTVWYSSVSDCFFIKASAEGTADVANVLAGKTFSNDNDTGLVGTMDLSNLISDNIKKDVTINGITGTLPTLPQEYLGQRVTAKTLLSSISTDGNFNANGTKIITIDNKWFISLVNNNIVKYDIANKTSTLLGSPSSTCQCIICSDDGSKIYVLTSEGIYSYTGSSWNLLVASISILVSSGNRTIVCSPDGLNIFYFQYVATNNVKKYNVSTNTTTTLYNCVGTVRADTIQWCDDNTIRFTALVNNVTNLYNYTVVNASTGVTTLTTFTPPTSYGYEYSSNGNIPRDSTAEYMYFLSSISNYILCLWNKKTNTFTGLISSSNCRLIGSAITRNYLMFADFQNIPANSTTTSTVYKGSIMMYYLVTPFQSIALSGDNYKIFQNDGYLYSNYIYQ
jgi:hypothetical protein